MVSSKLTITRLVNTTAQHERNSSRKYFACFFNTRFLDVSLKRVSNYSYLGVTCRYLQNWCLHTRELETVEVTESYTSVNAVNN